MIIACSFLTFDFEVYHVDTLIFGISTNLKLHLQSYKTLLKHGGSTRNIKSFW